MTEAELRDLEERARIYPGILAPETVLALVVAVREAWREALGAARSIQYQLQYITDQLVKRLEALEKEE